MTSAKGAALLESSEIRDTEMSAKYLDASAKAHAAGERLKSIEALEAAFTADPDNSEVCFRLAYQLDLVGEEDEAIHLYEECVHKPNPPLNALINLAVLYEDRGQYAAAERCIRQVLATEPNHNRARLYIKDIMASKAMVIEDQPLDPSELDAQLLETPVTDFDMSVRTRNCLRKMNIRTLSELLRTTEADLRSYKNVGESSLDEIKAMLAQKGLRLGQVADQVAGGAKQEVIEQLRAESGESPHLVRPVAELNLSVRARKALTLLNIQSVGDLCLRTEAELMGVKNFGMTSLLEIKERLAELGLGLRKLEE